MTEYIRAQQQRPTAPAARAEPDREAHVAVCPLCRAIRALITELDREDPRRWVPSVPPPPGEKGGSAMSAGSPARPDQ